MATVVPGLKFEGTESAGAVFPKPEYKGVAYDRGQYDPGTDTLVLTKEGQAPVAFNPSEWVLEVPVDKNDPSKGNWIVGETAHTPFKTKAAADAVAAAKFAGRNPTPRRLWAPEHVT